MDKRPIINKWHARLLSIALVFAVLCGMGWPGRAMVADAVESSETEVTPGEVALGEVTPGDPEEDEESLADTYLREIAALKAEAEAIGGTTADVTSMCAGVYERLMGVYDEAFAAWEADRITDDEMDAVDAATGEVMAVLNGYGYDPYAVAQTASSSGRYYHLDFRVAATVTVTVLNADGTTTTTTVTGTISNPTARIYNTGETEWSSHDWVKTDSDSGTKYFDVTFNSTTSSDNGAYEYMMNPNGTPGRQKAEFYNGDTAELTYTLTYTYNGTTYTNNLSETRVFAEGDNNCNSKNSSDTRRGFDISISTTDISSAISRSSLQIQKLWNDNNNQKRPKFITVKVYRTVNETETVYMTLTLAEDDTNSTYTMADNVTEDEDMVVTFADNYGVSITGLPQNYWAKNASTGEYEYVSCSYSIKEVQASGDANLTAVYGSFVYVDGTKKDSYIVTITNTLAYEQLAVKKIWKDEYDHSHDSVEVILKAYYNDTDGNEQQVPEEWLESFIGVGNGDTVTLSSNNNWYAVWGNMPVYYIDDSGNNYPITRFEAIETNVTIANTSNSETYEATVSAISTEKDENGNYYFTITNTPKPKNTTVKVKKTVAGNLGDWSKYFEFVATIYEGENVYSTTTFKLKNGEEIELTEVPIGAIIEIQETDGISNGYTIYINEVESQDGKYSTTISDDSVLTVSFKNEKWAIVDTGVLLDSLPYILILVIVIAGVIVMVIRRRRSYDED